MCTNTASKSKTGTRSSVMNVRSQTVRAGVHYGTIPSTFAGEMWIKQRTN
ncbi:hypothetical protein BH18THE2_BH18THE2_29730 [soil metagenome]